MPASYVHQCVANSICDALSIFENEPLRSAVLAGSEGPDPLFFSVLPAPGPVVPKVGSILHTRKTDEFLLALVPRAALAVHSEHGTECAPLEPSYKQLSEIGVGDISAEEAAYIRCPPGDSRNGHIKSCLKLLSHSTEGGMDISRPCENAVFLASCPCTADKAQDILLAL